MLQPPITRDEYESIELYLYGLRLLLDTDDYFKLGVIKTNKIAEEIQYMTITFAVLQRIFEPTKSPRRTVVAWKKKAYSKKEQLIPEEDKVFMFTSAQVAGKALDLTPGDICRVASGRRITIKGYAFMYIEDYEKAVYPGRAARKRVWDQ